MSTSGTKSSNKSRIATAIVAIGSGLGSWALESMYPEQPWFFHIAIVIAGLAASVTAADWLANRFNKTRGIIRFSFTSLFLFFCVAYGIYLESPLASHCPSAQTSRDLIRKNIGELMNFGRKEAIECLAISGEDLTNLDIDGAHIGRLKLPPKTILHDARMADTRLPHAQFPMAAMSGARMSQATLTGANFSGADLSGAIFGAHLLVTDDKGDRGKPACFRGASVSGAVFDGANLGRAYLIEVDGLTCEQLRKAKNWELSYRSEAHLCGSKKPLPALPDYVRKWGGTFEGCRKWLTERNSKSGAR